MKNKLLIVAETSAILKPLDPSSVKTIRLDTTHKIIEIAPGVKFGACTFGELPQRGRVAAFDQVTAGDQSGRNPRVGIVMSATRAMCSASIASAHRHPARS